MKMKSTDKILDAIELLINKKIKDLPCPKVFSSTVYSINPDNTYTIIKDKQKYNVKNGLGTTLPLGQNVWVMIPNGELRNMFICGVR